MSTLGSEDRSVPEVVFFLRNKHAVANTRWRTSITVLLRGGIGVGRVLEAFELPLQVVVSFRKKSILGFEGFKV